MTPTIPSTVLQAVPPASSVLLRAGEGTVVFEGDYTGPAYTCGSCEAVLIEGVRGACIVDLVLSCNACGAWNASPSSDVRRLDPDTIERPVVFPPGTYEITEPITVHERWVMASETALAGSALGTPARYGATENAPAEEA